MASNKLLFLVIFSLINKSLQSLDDNTLEDDSNVFKEAEKDIKKEQLAQNLGSILQNVMQNEGENIIGNIMSQLGKDNGGQILQGLSSLLSNSENKEKKDAPGVLDSLVGIASLFQGNNGNDGGQGGDGATLLRGLGSLLGQGGQDGEGNEAANLLQSLGSLFGGQANQGGQNGIDPALIGSMINLFANQGNTEEKKIESSKGKKTVAASKETKRSDKKPKVDQEFNVNDLLTMAGSLLGSGDQKSGKSGDVNLMTYLPAILQTVNSFIGVEAENRAKSHKEHSSFMPPFLEKFHILFDNFIHSDLGKQTIAALGAEKSFKVFLDEKGRFDYKKFGELMENHSYRRHWISTVTDRVASFLQFASEPQVYKSYLMTGQLLLNSYLKQQGFPKSIMFDPKNPVESISALVNYISKKYFEIKISSRNYVEPTVLYIQDVLKLIEKSGSSKSFGKPKELSNKLADTINLDIIEPLARVNRAFRFAKNVPKCDRYVLCLVNQERQNEDESLPGLKKLLYKGSSLVAGWFLSAQTGTPFWTLFTDITAEGDCQKLYTKKCDGFHVEELKVTTEYIHNEL